MTQANPADVKLAAVEPCDREAAATVYARMGGRSAVETVHANILGGYEDDYWLVQAFARHRLTALQRTPLRASEQETPTEHGEVAGDVQRLVIAARIVAFEDQGPEALRELDQASEAFAARVPWENDDDA